MTRPVLHLRSSAGLYGADNMVLSLVPALRRLGVDSLLLCLQNPLMERQALLERAQEMQVASSLLPCGGRFDWRTVRALRRRLRAQPRAIVHVHDYKTAFYAWLARGRLGHPIVSTCHGPFGRDLDALAMYQRLEVALMRRFERVCAVSEALIADLSRAGVRRERMGVIENGIDTERFHAGVAPWPLPAGIAPDATVFGTAMRLDTPKNPLGLLEAYAASREAPGRSVLLVAGDGPLREAMLERARALGIAQELHLLGVVNEPERFYAALDVFVLPSLYEGLPLALLEAMACARAVVATEVGQVPGVLRGLPAAVVPPGDVVALAAALRAARRQRPAEVGPLLRERVCERYSVQRMAADYAAVYRSLPAA